MKKARDTQRKRVYDLDSLIQNNIDDKQNLSLDECYELIDKSCKLFNIKTPRLKDGRGRRIATGGLFKIVLPRWSRRTEVVLHEVAHTITQHYKDSSAPHGPEFVDVLFQLLVHFKLASRRLLKQLAKEARVKVATGAACVDRRESPQRVVTINGKKFVTMAVEID